MIGADYMAPPRRVDPELLISAAAVTIGDEVLRVTLSSGEQIGVPLNRFPVLAAASPAQRADWEIVAGGTIVHWPQLDEDLSVFGLLPERVREAIPGSRAPNSTEVDLVGLWVAAASVRASHGRWGRPTPTRNPRTRPQILNSRHAA
jgi:Protein of unknown function (DUF2442)